mgnify:CR=1 FL=1
MTEERKGFQFRKLRNRLFVSYKYNITAFSYKITSSYFNFLNLTFSKNENEEILPIKAAFPLHSFAVNLKLSSETGVYLTEDKYKILALEQSIVTNIY